MEDLNKVKDKVKEIYEKYYKPLGFVWEDNSNKLSICAESYSFVKVPNVHISISIPQLYATYMVGLIREDLVEENGKFVVKKLDKPIIKISNGSWFCYDTTNVILKTRYNNIDDLLNDLIKQAEALKPSIWLVASWLGNYINKNGRVRVKFVDGQEYSLKASNIVSLVLNGNTIYIGYKTDNTNYYRRKFPTTEKVKGKLVAPMITEIPVCSKCKAKWFIDADEYADRCWKCGNNSFIHVKKLIWKEEKAVEFEWYPDAPYWKPDF